MTSGLADGVIAGTDAPPLPVARPHSTVRALLRVLGPAWIVMLADVDAPSVLTAAKAGTDFGYAMLLPIFALVPILYLVQEMTARLAIGTGLGHAALIRERYGFRWGAIAVASMMVIDLLAYTAQFAGIVLGASLLGILNVVVLAIPLTFLVRLSSDRALLGPLASAICLRPGARGSESRP